MESFPAELTHERLVSRVDARMRVERGAAVEGFPALVTFVRFFLRHNRNDTFQTWSSGSGPTSSGTVRNRQCLADLSFIFIINAY